MCALTRIYITCTSTNFVDVPELPSSRPGTQPLAMLLCGVFWRSDRYHYLLVLVMRALAMSIHVRTYLPKFNNEMHYYYDTIPTAVPWGLFLKKLIFVWDEILRQFGNNVLPSLSLSTSPHIKIRRITGEYCSRKRIVRFSLVSLSIHPRSLRGAERIRQGERRWSRPPKTALERSDLTEKFQFRASHTEAETKKNSRPKNKKNEHM